MSSDVESVVAGRMPRDAAPLEQHGVGQREVVVDDDARGHEHEPAPRQPCSDRASTRGHGQADDRDDRRRAPTVRERAAAAAAVGAATTTAHARGSGPSSSGAGRAQQEAPLVGIGGPVHELRPRSRAGRRRRARRATTRTTEPAVLQLMAAASAGRGAGRRRRRARPSTRWGGARGWRRARRPTPPTGPTDRGGAHGRVTAVEGGGQRGPGGEGEHGPCGTQQPGDEAGHADSGI